jgi:voltage-gated sodium channel
MTARVKDIEEHKQNGDMQVIKLKTVAMVDTDTFAWTMASFVSVNVVTIGFETEFSNGPSAGLFGAINNGFLLLYIMEFILRMLTHGLKALRDGFTVMDLILVSLAFLERIMASGGVARALPTFRTFRIVSLLLKNRFFMHSYALKAIVLLCRRMFVTLVWVMLVFVFVLWTLGTFAHLVISKSAEWNETLDPSKTFAPFVPLDIQEYFGSVWKSFFTLLQVTTLSQWAPHVARRIIKVYPITFGFFVAFLFVTTYGLLVAILSNLVQDSMAATQENLAAIRKAQKEKRRQTGMKIRDILADIDEDGSGELDESELAWALENTNLEVVLRELGVPVLDAASLVSLLDYSGDGLVSYEELVAGIVKMDELTTKRDFVMLGFWVKNLLNRTNHLEERLTKLCDQISFIRKRLGGSFGSLNHMIRTAKDTQIRQKAIHMLKTSGPALPPPLERTVIVKPTLPRTEPKVVIQSFASRLLGEPPKPKKAHDNDDRQIALFRNTMQPAPPRVAVGRRLAQQAEMKFQDKYAVGKDFRVNPENPNLTGLKRML